MAEETHKELAARARRLAGELEAALNEAKDRDLKIELQFRSLDLGTLREPDRHRLIIEINIFEEVK